MQVIKEQDWQVLPEFAQQEVYDFFVFIKQRYEQKSQKSYDDEAQMRALSNHSANAVEEWLDEKEDDVWK